MFGTRELAELDSRKAKLIAESAARRRELQEDWAKVQSAVSWVETAAGFVRQIKPFFSLAAPLLGIWAARKVSSRSGLWKKLNVGWRLWRATAAVWRKLHLDKA